MKVAISVPDPVFKAAERFAKERGIPRSQLFAEALEAYLEQYGPDVITARLDAAIASNLRLSAAPGNVEITKRESGLGKTSVVNASQVLTLDRTLLTEQVRQLSDKKMIEIDQGLRAVLGL